MFKKARYLRWGVLLATLFVEILAFWIGGPAGSPNSSFSETLVKKLMHPMSWTWVGWASLSMAWLWAEVAFLFYANGRRIRALLRRSRHEELVFDTGVHWLVLLRDIHISRLNDGDKPKLEEGLFVKDRKRSFAWHAIWLPVILAALTMVYFVGWLAWAIRNIPAFAETLTANAGSSLPADAGGAIAFLQETSQAIVQQLLAGSAALHEASRNAPLTTLAIIFSVWFTLTTLARISKSQALFSNVFALASQISSAVLIFSLFSTQWFDWLSPLYAFIPNHGLAAIGFIPLTLASAFYFPHILFWSSWRYAVVRDTETHDATLILLGGVLNSLQHRINLQRVVDTDIFQLWWERILNVGDIELKEMGGGEPEKIRHIFGPHQLLDHIREAIRESKKISGNQREFDNEEDNS